MMPGEQHLVLLSKEEAIQLGPSRHALGVGDPGAGSSAVEAPCMEGADDLFAFDATAMSEMWAKMRAERLEQVRVTVFVPEENEIASEVADGLDISGLEFVREAD